MCLVLVPVLCAWIGVCRSLQTSFLWKRWNLFLGSVAVRVSGRFNNSCYRINFHIGENQDFTWKCASLASEFGLSRLACHGACRRVLVHSNRLDKSWQSLKGVVRFSNGLERRQGLLELLVFVDCSCSCTDLRTMRWVWGIVAGQCLSWLVSACHVAWCSFVCMPSRMTAIFNPFSEALRRPQITEMCDLVCSGCIGRYGQWAWAIRDPFDWLGQWFQSTRRKVSGWLQRHKLSETWLDLVWCRCKSVWCPCRLLWSHERILWLWHVPEMLGSSWFNFWF